MDNSKMLLKMPLMKASNLLVLALILLAAAGFAVALYLTIEHFRGILPTCSFIDGCQNVLTSKYASVGPIPTAAFGVAYYLGVFFLASLFFFNSNPVLMKLLTLATVVGFFVSVYLVYLQIWIIDAICQYCMTSALICVLLLITDIAIWKKYLKKEDGEQPDQDPAF